MKDLNKILYDILLKIEKPKINGAFGINFILVTKYLNELNDEKSDNYKEFNEYFLNFYDFCFANSLENMVNDSLKFKY